MVKKRSKLEKKTDKEIKEERLWNEIRRKMKKEEEKLIKQYGKDYMNNTDYHKDFFSIKKRKSYGEVIKKSNYVSVISERGKIPFPEEKY